MRPGTRRLLASLAAAFTAAAVFSVFSSVFEREARAWVCCSTAAGHWDDPPVDWVYNPTGVPAAPITAVNSEASFMAAAGTWEADPGSSVDLDYRGSAANVILTGANGISNSTAIGDDVQAIPVGNGLPDTVAVDTGANGIANTAAAGDDTQLIPVGQGLPNQLCVAFSGGPAAGDDQVVVAGAVSFVTTGADGVCDTTAGLLPEVQVLPVGQGLPNQPAVDTGADGVADTAAVGDDAPNLIPVGQGQPNSVAVTAGPDFVLNTFAGLPDDMQSTASCTNNFDGINTVGWDNTLGAQTLAATVSIGGVLDNGIAQLVEGDICFNPAPNTFDVAIPVPGNRFDLESVALHEFGHFLNIDHPIGPPAIVAPNGQRTDGAPLPGDVYNKVVMYNWMPVGVPKRALLCDDQAAASFLHPPEVGGVPLVTELSPVGGGQRTGRDYILQNSGGCDFGDAPDWFIPMVIGNYPTLEYGEDFNNNAALSPNPDPDQMGFDWNQDGAMNTEDLNGNGVLDIVPGATHKDSRMEWLGPIFPGIVNPFLLPNWPEQFPILSPDPASIPAPGNVIAGQMSPRLLTAAVPASATFEPEMRRILMPDMDELDDGVSYRGPFIPGQTVLVDVVVKTNGLAKMPPVDRYDAGDASKRLYLHEWIDWDANGAWAGAVPALVAVAQCAVLPPNEHVLRWTGTPTADVLFSANFCGGTPVDADTRILTFRVNVPANVARTTFYERWRLDYAEDSGLNAQPWTDGLLALTLGQAGYGEVEDNPRMPVEVFWLFEGIPDGGYVKVTLFSDVVLVKTNPGDTVVDVAEDVADAINNHPDLPGLGVTATTQGSTVIVEGASESDITTTVTDTGILHNGHGVPPQDPPTFVTNDITTDTTWGVAPNTCPIILERPVFVGDPGGGNEATLTIIPPCVVRGQPRSAAVAPGSTAGSPGALIVTQAGRLDAQGEATNPIVFTTAATDVDDDGCADGVPPDSFFRYSGVEPFLDDIPLVAALAPLDKCGGANLSLWGGVVLLGRAPTNVGNAAGLGIGRTTIEGLTIPGFPVASATYGGHDPHHGSGVLKFLSIRHAGDEIGEANELNCLSLGGVGDGTILHHVECYANFDDGFEWFGGTVGGKFLVGVFIGDDTFDLDQGYTGVNQFLYGVMPTFDTAIGASYGSRSGDKGCECDGDDYEEGGNVATRYAPFAPGGPQLGLEPCPFSKAILVNVTILGSQPLTNLWGFPASSNRGIQLRNGFAGRIVNAIVVNAGAAGLDVAGGGTPGFDTSENVLAGWVAVVSSVFFNAAPFTGDGAGALANGDVLCATTGCAPNEYNPFFGFALSNDESALVDPTGDSWGKLVPGLLPAGPLDPRVSAVSFIGIGNAFPPSWPGKDGTASYQGAFERFVPLWTDGWTTLWMAGLN